MTTSHPEPQSGVVLAGKYRLVSLLGQGGMGSVWRAEHLSLQAPVAVKLIDPTIAKIPEALARFHREAKAAASLRSPNVVQILDHGVDESTGTPFIVMELMEGESLADRLERNHMLSPKDTAHVLLQVARALTRAHATGIVHRDLKPDNIFLVQNEDEEIAKILDFGIAKSEAHRIGAATSTGAVMGTAYYMSPEQISGSKEVDHRTDLWALGVIAHECLTGTRPFDGETLGGMVLKICTEPIRAPSTISNVPPGFDLWFERAVTRNPALRFQSAREMANDLRKVCDGITLSVGTPGEVSSLVDAKTELFDTAHPDTKGRPETKGSLSADTSAPLSHTTSTDSTSASALPIKRTPPWVWFAASVTLSAVAAGALVFLNATPSNEAASSSTETPAAVTQPQLQSQQSHPTSHPSPAAVEMPKSTLAEHPPSTHPPASAVAVAKVSVEDPTQQTAQTNEPTPAPSKPRTTKASAPPKPPAKPSPTQPKPGSLDSLLRNRK